MTAPDTVHELVAKFDQHRKEYQTHKNETELRREFLDPFFEALGWDVFNKNSYSERFKEVLHEVSVEVEGKAKAADYAFRVGGKTIFFVEAKKPSVNISVDPEPAFQIRRYAWSAKLPISILTDFEQLAVYECRTKPSHKDKASFGRVKLYHYSEYVEKWDEIAAVFSRDAVLHGAFDQFAEDTKGKKGTAQVDDAFLEEIECWRDILARNIALRNPSIRNERELNFAVQLTIDRIIFLRIGEDRGMEPEGQLQTIGNGHQIYAELVALFRRADIRYNSGLFHFSKEKDQSSNPDTLTPDLKIDDKVLKNILRNLYYPESPYVFTYLSADILGQVYEQFLGKVIRLTAGHQARVEEKPEVRKAGGVYYTPTYIVSYIVKNTVGKLLEGKTPRQATKIKVLDPACGSGSFLLGAYQFLLDWHVNWYAENNPEKWAKGSKPAIYQAVGGDWRLTTAEKKNILLNNIHGVDIDAQAVEVTKLSLLLKVLEEESGQLSLGFERVLPDLGKNIKCGNSLIGPDYYEGRQLDLGLFDEEEQYRVNAFDWKKEFAHILIQGGFDAVIGNPPYLFITELTPHYKEYFFQRYTTTEYRFDVYGLFSELAVRTLLHENGYLSFIIPHTLLSNDSFTKLRKLLLSETSLHLVIDIGPGVFDGARNETMIIVVQKKLPTKYVEIKVVNTNSKQFPMAIKEFSIHQNIWNNHDKASWLVKASENELLILSKLESAKYILGSLCTINQGLRTGNNQKYVNVTKENELWQPVVGGKNIDRYATLQEDVYVCYDPKLLDAPRKREIFESEEKIIVQEIRNISLNRRIVATFDNAQFYCLQSTNVINLIQDKKKQINLKYILGIINSTVVNYFFRLRFSGNNHIASNQLAQIPVPGPEEDQQVNIVALVDTILQLHKRLASAKTPQDKEMLSRQIESTDAAIDRLVYELYGLTEEEIRIVEGE